MFPDRYFPRRYFSPRYWPRGASVVRVGTCFDLSITPTFLLSVSLAETNLFQVLIDYTFNVVLDIINTYIMDSYLVLTYQLNSLVTIDTYLFDLIFSSVDLSVSHADTYQLDAQLQTLLLSMTTDVTYDLNLEITDTYISRINIGSCLDNC